MTDDKPLDAVGVVTSSLGKSDFRSSRQEKLAKVEDLLSAFDLLLGCIESDCGRKAHLKKIKTKVKDTRKALRNIPVPKGLQ